MAWWKLLKGWVPESSQVMSRLVHIGISWYESRGNSDGTTIPLPIATRQGVVDERISTNVSLSFGRPLAQSHHTTRDTAGGTTRLWRERDMGRLRCPGAGGCPKKERAL